MLSDEFRTACHNGDMSIRHLVFFYEQFLYQDHNRCPKGVRARIFSCEFNRVHPYQRVIPLSLRHSCQILAQGLGKTFLFSVKRFPRSTGAVQGFCWNRYSISLCPSGRRFPDFSASFSLKAAAPFAKDPSGDDGGATAGSL